MIKWYIFRITSMPYTCRFVFIVIQLETPILLHESYYYRYLYIKKTSFIFEAYCLAMVEYFSFNFYFINYL